MTTKSPLIPPKRVPFFGHAVGRVGYAALVLIIATGPALLFFAPCSFRTTRGHVPRDPVDFYKLFSDDVAYISGSRNWERTVSNLFLPHNTHIVPAWRIVTYGLVSIAGSLNRIAEVLAYASYGILVAVMLMVGRLVARETGRGGLGLAAMALMGTTSLLLTPAIWYSAGQPLWAGLGILFTLWYGQAYRRTGRWPALVLTALTVPIAGWMWTVGHMAGPAAAVYLWADGRQRCRRAALVPLLATVLTIAGTLAWAGGRIDSRTSLHGRTIKNAIRPVEGFFHTTQSIPENLLFGNLGLTAFTNQMQGVLITFMLILVWSRRWWTSLPYLWRSVESLPPGERYHFLAYPTRPLECAGAALVVGGYMMVWLFRGYLEFKFLRTINLHFLVPWYDAIPQIGFVLVATGWWSAWQTSSATAAAKLHGRELVPATPERLTRAGALAVLLVPVVMIGLNHARVEHLVRSSVPPLLPSEKLKFPVDYLQTLRANAVLMHRSEWQRAYIRRLAMAERIASRMGWTPQTLRSALGHKTIPGVVGSLSPPLYDLYDAVALLDLPRAGPPADPATVRAALGELLADGPEPRPGWLLPTEPWPPPEDDPRIPK
jgi:hypothetical protein